MKNINWDNVEEAKGYEKLPAGGYICGITSVEDKPDKEYLTIEFDIAEGEHKNYYRELYDRKNFWGAHFIKSYKQSAQGFFKKFLLAVEASNPGFKFNNDEIALKRKKVGITIGYEEYVGADGTIKERIYADDFLPVDDIKKGNYNIPKLKKVDDDTYDRVADNASKKSEEITADDDLPFS